MKITNNHGLPEAIVRAVSNDPYSKAGSDYSVTQLIDPPQLRRLMRDNMQDVTEDVAERIWSLYGQSVHAILERAGRPGDVVEQRFFMPTDFGVVSGQVDLYTPDDQILSDFKMTSVWKIKSAMQKPVREWEAQLNMQAALMRHAGIYPKALQIVAFGRDWSRGAAMREKDYPPRAVTIPIRMWEDDEALSYIELRADAHWNVMEKGAHVDCSDEERWKRDDQFAVMKKGSKRALRLLDSIDDVKAFLIDKGLAETDSDGDMHIADGYYVETRPGSYVRCAEYCPVAEFCPQYTRV